MLMLDSEVIWVAVDFEAPGLFAGRVTTASGIELSS
jgi:hypothetical protein